MKNKSGISKQLFIALSILNLSVTLFSAFIGYFIYNYAIENGWLLLNEVQEDWADFHFVDWIWLFTVILGGSVISLIIGMQLAKRFVGPINSLAEAANTISLGDLSARADNSQTHSAEIAGLIHNFNDMAEKLENSVKNAQMWNAAIAHELRTPITILQGRLQGIVDGVFEPNPTLMQNLLNQVEGLSYLVEDLRTLSLVENQQLRLNIESVNFQLSVDKVISMFSERLENAQISIQTELSEQCVDCDRQRMEQVLIALIDNVVRYANAGIVQIRSKIETDQWVLEIEDQGPGIPQQHQQELFNPFFRLEQSRNKEFGGTGLGLAVVHAIVIAHNGLIEYKNFNNNSKFSITIPFGKDHI